MNALLASRQFYAVDLYTITLSGGTVLRYCQGPADIVYGGHTFSSGGTVGPYFDRKDNKAKVRWAVGVGVDSLTIDVIPGTSTILGQPFLSAVRFGLFDGAEFQLERAFMATYGDTSAGTVIMFAGRVAEIDAGRTLATFTINDHRELLTQNLPRNLFQPSCVNTLYDASCGVVAASYSAAGTVLAGTTNSFIMTSLIQATGYFDRGKVTFLTGANTGLSVGVSSWDAGPPGVLTLTGPIPVAPAAGDTFTAFAGCDHTIGGGGCAKFSNLGRFRGFPYIPAPETAV